MLDQDRSNTIPLRADLEGAIFAYDCRMRLLKRALLASRKARIQLVILCFDCGYDCRWVLKHVFKIRFRRCDFFLRPSYATFVARAARVNQRSYTTRHSNILIVATTVVGF